MKKAFFSSLYNLYQAFAREEIKGLTIPAINIRTLTHDIARVIFRIAKTHNIGAFILEIARSEQRYTKQSPKEYASSILKAATAENYQGPLFLQGDHYQFNKKIFENDPQKEINNLKNLINQSIESGFYNIDIDASTLVDYSKNSLDEQQKNNYQMTALLTKHVREIEPKNVTVTVGGEIGHIGGKNSTIQELEAFMEGLLKEVQNGKTQGISKVSIQTGTSHGGIPLADGTIKQVKIDFEVLKNIGRVAREKYHLAGVVQHGASTLSDELFDQFPKVSTLEIHLSTEFQNIVFDYLPNNLKSEMYQWLKNNLKSEWQKDWSEEQFLYKTRKKALGIFKQQLANLSQKEKRPILQALEKKFLLIFEKLNIFDSKKIVDQYA